MGINAGNVKGERKESNFAEKQEDLDGVYPARLVQVIDLGLQPQRAFKGEDKKPAHEVYYTFELVDTFMLDKDGKEIEDKPRWVSASFPLHPLVADRAKSTKLANALDPDNELNGDFGRMLGFPLNLTLSTQHKGDKTYTNILGFAAMRARDAAKTPELVNPTKVFDLDAPDVEVFGSLPQWLQDKIKGNLNFQHSKLQKALGDAPEAPKGDDKGEPEQPAVEAEKPAGDDVPW